MKPEKKRRLEQKGWKVGSAEEFLGLTPEEAAMVELRLRLATVVGARDFTRRFCARW